MFCEKHCNLLVYIDVIIIPYLIVQCSQKQIVKRISIVTTLNQRQDIKQSMPGIIQLSFEFWTDATKKITFLLMEWQWQNIMASHWCFYKDVSTEAVIWRQSTRKTVLRNFAKFKGKYLCLSLNQVILLKKGSGTSVSLWVLQICLKQLIIIKELKILERLWTMLLFL